MRSIVLLPVVNGNCVSFEIDNLLIRDPKIKNYDLFIEFGDGTFTSFQIKEDDKETGRTTVFSSCKHQYSQLGKYTVRACIKAIYSDDGDPLYPTIPGVEVRSIANSPCSSPVASKLSNPRVSNGPSLLGSHMPKFLEKNVYVINFNRVQLSSGQNQLILFFNEKNKPYTQWDAPEGFPGNKCRIGDTVQFSSAGTTQSLTGLTGFNSDLPEWREQIDKYQHYIAFNLNAVDGTNHNNIFLDLQGHKELEDAIMEEESSGKERVAMSVCHVKTGQTTLELVSTYHYKSEPLTRFHDPNYIYVSPEYVRPEDISTTIWTYDVSISNDGKGTASDVCAHVVLNTKFFDLSTVIGVETSPFRHDRMEVKKDGVSFYWDNIALPGIDFPNENKLNLRFSIQPKQRYVLTEKLTAHAVVDMYSGSIKETTLTEELAITEITDDNRTRELHLSDILPELPNDIRII